MKELFWVRVQYASKGSSAVRPTNGLYLYLFLQDVGLLQCKVQCNTCSADMTWSVDNSVSDGYQLRCWRRTGGTRCSNSRSIKHGSWFHQSNLCTPCDVPGVVSAIPPPGTAPHNTCHLKVRVRS
jgi:hypothetical protein